MRRIDSSMQNIEAVDTAYLRMPMKVSSSQGSTSQCSSRPTVRSFGLEVISLGRGTS